MELLQSGEHEPPALGTAIRNSNPEHLGTDGRTDGHTRVCPNTRVTHKHGIQTFRSVPLADPKVRAPGKDKG